MSTPNVTPNPDQTLAQRIRAKFPGAYDDMDDTTLEQKVLAKYPQYSDLPRTKTTPTGLANQALSSTGISVNGPGIPNTPNVRPMNALEKLGVWASTPSESVLQAQAAYKAKNGNVGMPGSFEGHPENVGEYIPQGPGNIASGVAQIARGNISKGGHQIITGAGNTMLPALPFLAAGAPAATAMGIGGGKAGQVIAQQGAEALGANPEQAQFAGDLGGLAAGYGSVKALPFLQSTIPSQSRAGQMFQDVMAVAKDKPVPMTGELNDAIARYQQLVENGNSRSVAVGKLIKKTQGDGITYQDARDFETSLGRLSAQESQRLSPVMKAQLNDIRFALRNAVRGTLQPTGQEGTYNAALSEYAKASRVNEAAQSGIDWLKQRLPWLAYGYAAKKGYDALK